LIQGKAQHSQGRGVGDPVLFELWAGAARVSGVLVSKGDIAPGYDADSRSSIRTRVLSCTPRNLNRTKATRRSIRVPFLRAELVYDDGNVIGPARGEYLRRSRTQALNRIDVGRLYEQWRKI
jgi:hypothetical protein